VAAHRVLDMGNPSTLAMLGAMGAFALATTCAAQDGDAICQAMRVVARAANGDAGTWLDRHTRNDGVEVLCRARTVQFRRFSTLPSGALNKDWKDRQQQDWDRYYCSDYAWRPAIAAGWNILLSMTTRAGESAKIIAACR
jgi:hypothetical protein